MTEALLEVTGEVCCSHLADGRIVRLSGAITADQAPRLRLALLTPLPEDCRDVVIDAGEVTAVSDDALGILLAAPVWATLHGSRLLLSRSSAALDEALDEVDARAELPRLQPLTGGK